MIELRGISIARDNSGNKIKLTVRGKRGDDYKTLEFPATVPFNQGQIIKFIGDQLGIPPGEITWPPHVKIPGE